eukprot:7629659-Heterocapsa_arctica.AAC.1
MKPWRIQASSDMLIKPLSQQCTGGHTHVTLRGKEALRSGLYTPKLVRTIWRVLTGRGQRMRAVAPVGEAASSS